MFTEAFLTYCCPYLSLRTSEWQTHTHRGLIRPHNARLICCAARRTEAFTECTCLVKSNPVFLCSPSQPLATTTTSLVTAVVYMVSPGVESPVTYDLARTVDCKSQQSNSLLIDADSLIWLMAPQHSLWWMDGCQCMCACTCSRYSSNLCMLIKIQYDQAMITWTQTRERMKDTWKICNQNSFVVVLHVLVVVLSHL